MSFVSFTVMDHHTSVMELEFVMVLMGVGNGMAMAPATTAILESLPRERAGAGSAVNSTVRQVGGALGVAVLGPLLSTVYRSSISDALTALPAPVRRPAGESIGATQILAQRFAGAIPDRGASLVRAASDAFIHAMHVTAAAGSVVMVVAVAVVLFGMPKETGRATQRRSRSA